MLAAPVMAADWSFYGSQRLATFDAVVILDHGDGVGANGQDDDSGHPMVSFRATPAWAPMSRPTRSAAGSSSVAGKERA